MSDIDPSAQARVDEILAGFRGDSIPLSEIPTGAPNDESATRGKDFGAPDRSREPATDPKRHPFEVYIASFFSSDVEELNVYVAWGTILNDEANIADVFTIAHRDDLFNFAGPGDWIWLEVVFQLDGTITSADMKTGGTWADYPALYRDDGASGNTWYHPICQTRDSLTAKSAGKPNSPFPDSGEFPDFKPQLVIAQLTNTHLVKRRECSGDDLTRLWKLVPGPGGGL